MGSGHPTLIPQKGQNVNGMIDITFDFRSDARGKDSDAYSPTLNLYHRLLWSKELPNGEVMELQSGGAPYALNWKDFWFSSDTIIVEMCLIASSTFVAANIGPAVVKVAAKVMAAAAKRDNKSAITGLLGIITQVNIAGVGRFVIAFGDNSKYFNENLHVFFNNRKWDKFKRPGAKQGVEVNQDENYKFEKGMEDILRLMMLDSTQTRILYSLEKLLLEYDISRTKKPVDQEAKKEWSMVWQEQIGSMVNESPLTYFIHDERWLYEELYKFADAESNHRWIYAMTMELCTFKPYAPLGTEEDKSYKGLKLESDYIGDKYVVRQTVVSHKDTELICKYFKHYKGMIDGSTKKLLIGAGSAGAVAVAAGAAAFSLAPAIAVALVGNAFPGLHGIALVNAALAALGGGSLAAGGLGMAGGTAVITGGGALIGLTGTSAVTAATLMLSGSKEYWDNEFAKRLTFVKFILKDKLGETEKVVAIKHHVALITELAENQLKEMKNDHTPLDKEAIERTENYVKYLRKLNGEMKKI